MVAAACERYKVCGTTGMCLLRLTSVAKLIIHVNDESINCSPKFKEIFKVVGIAGHAPAIEMLRDVAAT